MAQKAAPVCGSQILIFTAGKYSKSSSAKLHAEDLSINTVRVVCRTPSSRFLVLFDAKKYENTLLAFQRSARMRDAIALLYLDDAVSGPVLDILRDSGLFEKVQPLQFDVSENGAG